MPERAPGKNPPQRKPPAPVPAVRRGATRRRPPPGPGPAGWGEAAAAASLPARRGRPRDARPGRPGRASARPRPDGAGRLASARRTSCSSAARSRARSQAGPSRSPRRTGRCWRTPRWPPARTRGTPSSRPARRSAAGPGRPPTTAARSCTGWPKCSRAGRGSSPTRSSLQNAGATAGEAARAGRRQAIDRWVWYAGWPDKVAQVAGRRQPGGRPVLQPQRPGADRGRGGARPAGRGPARPGQRARAGDRHRQHRGAGGRRAGGAARGDPGRGAGHLRRARRRGQRADRAGRGAGPGARRAPWTSTRST